MSLLFSMRGGREEMDNPAFNFSVNSFAGRVSNIMEMWHILANLKCKVKLGEKDAMEFLIQ